MMKRHTYPLAHHLATLAPNVHVFEEPGQVHVTHLCGVEPQSPDVLHLTVPEMGAEYIVIVSSAEGVERFACKGNSVNRITISGRNMAAAVAALVPTTDSEQRILDLIDQWHDDDEDRGPLWSYLGMTWSEYKGWVEQHPHLERHLSAAHGAQSAQVNAKDAARSTAQALEVRADDLTNMANELRATAKFIRDQFTS